MRAVYFERNAESDFHIHAGSYVTGVYFPEENIILYREQHGSFGGQTYSILDDSKTLEEVKSAISERSGKIPRVEGVTYSGIRKFECESSEIKRLIQNARIEKGLREVVNSGIEALLKQGSGK